MSFNDDIRRAAGRSVDDPQPAAAGDFGIGRGGTCAYRPEPPPSMNARIRGAVVERHERRAELARSFE